MESHTSIVGAERIFGYSALETVGQKGGILMPSGESGESEILERLKRDGSILPYETRLTRKDGASIDVSLSVTSISDPNRPGNRRIHPYSGHQRKEAQKIEL